LKPENLMIDQFGKCCLFAIFGTVCFIAMCSETRTSAFVFVFRFQRNENTKSHRMVWLIIYKITVRSGFTANSDKCLY